MKTVRTSICIPEHLHKMVKDNHLCLTDMVIKMLNEKAEEIQTGSEVEVPPTADQKIDAVLEKLNGDHTITQYISSAGRVHRKVVAYTNARIESEAGVILNTRQKERVKEFLLSQFEHVREDIRTWHPPIDEITGKRLNNFAINTGYRARFQIEGKTPELLREVGEKFIKASGPVTPTSLESIIEHLKMKF
ncbi:MAG: hypothetical protein WC277_06575 [Bacilli bacterium]